MIFTYLFLGYGQLSQKAHPWGLSALRYVKIVALGFCVRAWESSFIWNGLLSPLKVLSSWSNTFFGTSAEVMCIASLSLNCIAHVEIGALQHILLHMIAYLFLLYICSAMCSAIVAAMQLLQCCTCRNAAMPVWYTNLYISAEGFLAFI